MMSPFGTPCLITLRFNCSVEKSCVEWKCNIVRDSSCEPNFSSDIFVVCGQTRTIVRLLDNGRVVRHAIVEKRIRPLHRVKILASGLYSMDE